MIHLLMVIGLMAGDTPVNPAVVPPYPLPVAADPTTRVECEIVLAVAPHNGNVSPILGVERSGEAELDCTAVFREAGWPEFIGPGNRNYRGGTHYTRPSFRGRNKASLVEGTSIGGGFGSSSRLKVKRRHGKWMKTGEELIAIT